MKYVKPFFRVALFTAIAIVVHIAGAYAQVEVDTLEKPNYWTDDEYSVFLELNKVRTNPKAYAESIKALGPVLRRFVSTPVEFDLALSEAVEYLENANPVGPLAPCYGLTLSAREHAKYLNDSNTRGHGHDPVGRLNRYGTLLGKAAENVEIGEDTVQEAIAKLVIDMTVPDRSHRINIMDPEFQVVGVATGPHPTWDRAIVTDFAAKYREKGNMQ